MTNLLRQEIATAAHTLVVKVGTRVLTRADGTLNVERIGALAEELSDLRQTGRRVALVTSGAVGAGMNQLGLQKRPTDLAQLQAVAAIGQTKLIEAYDRTFRKHHLHAAQVLLTAEDLDDRTHYLNVRNTLFSVLAFDAIPLINENDTVAVDELMTTFGDNDRLAAMVTNLLRAPLLIILSDIDGLYDGDPQDEHSRIVPTVTAIDNAVQQFVRDKSSGLSKGGMASKLQAARIVTSAGENMIIASGRRPGILKQILLGDEIGTLFVAQGKSITPRKRWIGFSAQPKGVLVLDAGAERAIVEQGRSLLAIGITQVTGKFQKGDVVALCDAGHAELARGLTNYSSEDIRRIQGVPSHQIAELLGHRPYEEVVHRNNLATL